MTSGIHPRIGLVCAWPWRMPQGGGTGRFLTGLSGALASLGPSIVAIDADLDTTDYASFVEGRLEWNRRLAADPRLRGLDLLLALDCDGFLLPGPPEGIPRVVCPQAVFAHVSRTEPEPYRSALLAQAEAEERNVRAAAAVVVPSRYAAGCAADAYSLDRDRIHVIPHGFDLARWRRLLAAAPARRDRDRPVVLSVGRLYPRKGHDLLLRAFAGLRGLSPPPLLRIVGGGIDRERLGRLAIDLGVDRSVSFEGDIREEERLAEFYAGADLFCLPSLHETFGFVYLEAMAAGLPVVAARAGAAPEVLGDAGRLVPPGDEDALREQIGSVLRDGALREAMARSGRASVERFGWPEAARGYLAVIRSILDGPGSGGRRFGA